MRTLASFRNSAAAQDGCQPGGATGHGGAGEGARDAHERSADGGDPEGVHRLLYLPYDPLLPLLPDERPGVLPLRREHQEHLHQDIDALR